jgi:hypothetical protein
MQDDLITDEVRQAASVAVSKVCPRMSALTIDRAAYAALTAALPMIRAGVVEAIASHVERFTPDHDDCISDFSAGFRGGYEDAAAAIRKLGAGDA